MMKTGLLTFVAFFILITTTVQAQDSQLDSKRSLSSPDFPGALVFDLGFNGFNTAPDTMDLSWWKSKSISVYYMQSFDIGKKFTFNPAIGLSLEKYSFVKDVTLGYVENTQGENVIGVVEIEADEVLKSKMAINYIDLPVEFRYYPRGNDKKGSIYFALGGSLGLLMESHTKTKFKENGITKTVKLKDDFRQNNWRYGLQARFGVGSVNFFYKQYRSNIFKSDGPAGTENTTSQTIGISFSGF